MIKIILILLLIAVLRAFLQQKSLLLTKRLLGIAMFMFLVTLVIQPEISQKIANYVGVDRGVDLIFYLAHLFLLLLIVNLWRRTVLLGDSVTKLSREIAILGAKKPDPETQDDQTQTDPASQP